MRREKRWPALILLALLALGLQSCLGVGENAPAFKNNTGQVGINTTDQAKFSGKIYFVSNHILYVLDGADASHTPHPLTSQKLEVHDPAVSPDGRQIAFIARYKNYSDLMLMGADGSNVHILRSGKGDYVSNPYSDAPKATYVWYLQPAWHPDGKHLLFLSDLGKFDVASGVNDFLHDPQIYSISLDNAGVPVPQEIACASYGGGGLRDPGYRPGHLDQLIYSAYYYDTNQTDMYRQLYLTNPEAVASHPCVYNKGSLSFDPAVPLTPQGATIVNQNPAFSPDGNAILYTHDEDATHKSIYVMPVAENITNVPMSPAVAEKAMEPYKRSMGLASAKLVTAQYLSFPFWSPNGRQIAYIGYANFTFDIWLANIVKDAQTGAYSIKPNSQVQLTDTNGQLDPTSRPCWVP